MRRLPVLWLVEHLARESDAACATASLLRSRFGVQVEIWHMYRDAERLLREVVPDVVVHPFFYFVDGALATEDFVACWPDALHFNLAWEQIHYPAHATVKAPADAFTRERVLHHAWGEFYRRYLHEHGVPDQHIFVNGHPAYALYDEPYRRFYKTRRELARTHALEDSARWVFVPENYRWAFLSANRLATFERWGGNGAEASDLRDFSRQSLATVLEWCADVARTSGVELIFRTRPSVGAEQMKSFADRVLGPGASAIHFIKQESVREWVLAADVVISSYSTTLIEAALADKPAYMMEPFPIPQALTCDWYALVPSLTSRSAFKNACLDSGRPPRELGVWARQEMLRLGDPIERLAAHIAALARQHGKPTRNGRAVDMARAQSARLPQRVYFNPTSHDQDAFDQDFINGKLDAWTRTLNGTHRMTVITDTIINKTMDRDDLLTPEGLRETAAINDLLRSLYAKGLAPSSWVGTLPAPEQLERGEIVREPPERLGLDQRRDYQPLPDAADDARIPWFLYWEIFWVLKVTRPFLRPGARLLDAGGASSLFSCYLGSMGFQVDTVDLNDKLIVNNNRIAERMGWNSRAVAMNMASLEYPDESFDHVYSICVFEHLDYPIKQAALREIARCLRPGGLLALTFDYRNPAPGVRGFGKDPRPINQISSPADLQRTFMTDPRLDVIGNLEFQDSGKSYLSHPKYDYAPYTFGSLFLRKK